MSNGTQEVKIVMVGKDGQALLGNHFHVLEDETCVVFRTTDPQAFSDYLFVHKNYKRGDIIVTYDESSIHALPGKPDHSDSEIAECSMVESPIIAMIRATRTSVSVAAFEKFLYTVRRFYDKTGKDLYDQVQHLVVEKVTKMERRADNQGNFHYTVTRTGGKDDIVPSPTIKFTVPLFDSVDDTVDIEFDVHLEYREIDGGVAIAYSLVNPFFEEDLRNMKKQAIKKIIHGFAVQVLAGTAKIVAGTDAWKYKENGLN